MSMATKKKATKKQAAETPDSIGPETDEFLDTLWSVLHASGSAEIAPRNTLAALLAAARGVELLLSSRFDQDGRSIYDIGAAHGMVHSLPSDALLSLTEQVALSWAHPPAKPPKPRQGSKPGPRKASKRKARK